MQSRPTWKQLLARDEPLLLPGAHDALSARLIERAGFDAYVIGGYALVGSRYALPDLGLAGFGEMSAGMRDIMSATRAAGTGRLRRRLRRRQERRAHAPRVRSDGRIGHLHGGPEGAEALRPHGRQGCDRCRNDGDQAARRSRGPAEPRYFHHRPHRRARGARPGRGFAPGRALSEGRRRRAVHRSAAEHGGAGAGRPGVSGRAAARQHGRRRRHDAGDSTYRARIDSASRWLPTRFR